MGRRRFLSISCCLLALTGCGYSPKFSTPATGNSQYSGSVHGGQQPIVGAAIQLYTVGTTADGSAATPLLTSTVTSDATGSFTITGLYSCTSATQVYIVATGGNPGLSAANPNIALMAALGPCSSLTPSTFININELTTVAAVSALAPYMTSISAIGSSPSDAASLASAFTLANELVDTATGTSPGANLPSGFTVPTAELNTLADILSACINSTGGTAGDGSLCGQLFSLTTVTPNPAPANTIAAMLNIANNPTLNVSALYALTPPTPPFQPTLTAAPASFAVVATSSSGGLQANPLSLTFPDTPVGVASLAQTSTIQNTTASSTLTLTVTISGTNASDFAFVNSCDFAGNIPPAGICQVHVTATPSGTGARTANLMISTGQGQPLFIPLSVNGITPPANLVTLTPSTLTYILAGTAQDLTLTNNGSTTLNISSIQESDYNEQGLGGTGFSIVDSTCGTSLAAQASCTISVASSAVTGDAHGNPLRAGGSIIVLDNAAGGYQYATLNSRNLGSVGYAVESFPATQQGYSQTLSASYMGYNAYGEFAWPSISFGSVAGANPSDFSVQLLQNNSVTTQPCDPTPLSQRSGTTCGMTYTFTPTATGARSAKAYLTYSGNYSQPPTGSIGQPYVFLQANGATAGPSFTIGVSALNALTSYLPNNIDPNSVGSQTITLQNNGSTTLNIAASFSGAAAPYLAADLTNCSTPVAPHGSCPIKITFNGSSIGGFGGTLTLNDTNSTFSLSVPVSATTSWWPLGVSPGSLNFGNQPVGSTSTKQYFRVGNSDLVPIGHAIGVSLQANSSFTLPDGSTCPASTSALCQLTVAFAPQAAGNVSEYLTITDQTSNLQTIIHLAGTGVTPDYTLSAYSLAFPPQTVGSSSTTTVTLTNVNTHSITVSGVSVTGASNGNFTETNNCSTVAVNGNCSINITFTPIAGMQSAYIGISSNASNSVPGINVTGTGQ